MAKIPFSNASISRGKLLKLKPKVVSAGSLIDVMEKYVDFGKVLWYKFTGRKDDIGKLIERHDVQKGFK